VYATVGLPTWDTWRKVNRSPERRALRHRALRPLLAPLVEASAFVGGRIPNGWQLACGVDRHGADIAPAEAA
jgi:hypothetical protein